MSADPQLGQTSSRSSSSRVVSGPRRETKKPGSSGVLARHSAQATSGSRFRPKLHAASSTTTAIVAELLYANYPQAREAVGSVIIPAGELTAEDAVASSRSAVPVVSHAARQDLRPTKTQAGWGRASIVSVPALLKIVDHMVTKDQPSSDRKADDRARYRQSD